MWFCLALIGFGILIVGKWGTRNDPKSLKCDCGESRFDVV